MPNPENNPARTAAEVLLTLSEMRQHPRKIDDAVANRGLAVGELLMTSVGNEKRALLTPYYPAIQFAGNIFDRLEWSQTYSRPFVEASVRFSVRRQMAALTLRLAVDPDDRTVSEANWHFPLTQKSIDSIEMPEDVAAVMFSNCDKAYPIGGRSGLVVVTDDRQKRGNWSISHSVDPEAVITGMAMHVSELEFTKL